MRLFVIILCLLVCPVCCPFNASSQNLHTQEQPLGNSTVRIETFQWVDTGLNASAAVKVSLKNNTRDKTIKSVQLTLLAMDKQGILLQQEGTTLRRLVSRDTIGPGNAKTLSFGKAFTIPNIDSILLKEVVVEFTNGALEFLRK